MGFNHLTISSPLTPVLQVLDQRRSPDSIVVIQDQNLHDHPEVDANGNPVWTGDEAWGRPLVHPGWGQLAVPNVFPPHSPVGHSKQGPDADAESGTSTHSCLGNISNWGKFDGGL